MDQFDLVTDEAVEDDMAAKGDGSYSVAQFSSGPSNLRMRGQADQEQVESIDKGGGDGVAPALT